MPQAWPLTHCQHRLLLQKCNRLYEALWLPLPPNPPSTPSTVHSFRVGAGHCGLMHGACPSVRPQCNTHQLHADYEGWPCGSEVQDRNPGLGLFLKEETVVGPPVLVLRDTCHLCALHHSRLDVLRWAPRSQPTRGGPQRSPLTPPQN